MASVNMNFIFILSVILKGIGAVLEIALQILLTKLIGLSGYGSYSTWISGADLLFWVFFSGLIKCNTYYLSRGSSSLSHFKKLYYIRYMLPLAAVFVLVLILLKRPAFCIILAITIAETFIMDQSSTLLARGIYHTSLIGEYILGRLFLLLGVCFLGFTGHLDLGKTIVLYLVQYVLVFFFFLYRSMKCGAKSNKKDISDTVSIPKLLQYQRSDILQAMIGQLPVILQYFFVGAFEAGIVSIVLLVKKLINFVSGPTSKIFLPEFSRLYQAGDKKELASSFSMIMRIQMLFVGPLSVVLIGYPQVILNFLAKEMLTQTGLFIGCSFVFLFAATLGPCGGLMQMTDHEKADNVFREAAIFLMLLVFAVMHRNPLFALYGLCIQTFAESFSKFVFVCRWFGYIPVKIRTYVSWWILPGFFILITCLFHLQASILMMLLMSGSVFLFRLIMELCSDNNLFRLLSSRKK